MNSPSWCYLLKCKVSGNSARCAAKNHLAGGAIDDMGLIGVLETRKETIRKLPPIMVQELVVTEESGKQV